MALGFNAWAGFGVRGGERSGERFTARHESQQALESVGERVVNVSLHFCKEYKTGWAATREVQVLSFDWGRNI